MTLAVALGYPGAPPMIVAVPVPVAVTCTFAVREPAATTTEDGAVATEGFDELSVTVNPPAGACTGSVTTSVCVDPMPVIVRLVGENPNAGDPELTTTVSLLPVMLYEAAEIVADPIDTPFNIGDCTVVVAPCGIRMFSGVIVTFPVSLLVRLMNTPPDGAGLDNVIGNATCWPGATITPEGRMMSRVNVTATFADAADTVAKLVVAVITADPAPVAVTGTLMLLEFAAIVAVAGTVATLVLFEARLTARAAGAGTDRFN